MCAFFDVGHCTFGAQAVYMQNLFQYSDHPITSHDLTLTFSKGSPSHLGWFGNKLIHLVLG